MLKERIQYLCSRRGISRKELTEGLITLTHFSNILAGRYSLASDLAQAMSKRLGVCPEYLLMAADCPDTIMKKNDEMTDIAISLTGTGAYLESLPIVANELSLELGANLCAACLSFQLGRLDRCRELHETYLDFYLDEFTDTKIEALSPPLKKMFYVYKSLLSRSHQKHDSTLFYLDKLLELVVDRNETWMAVQKFRIETLILLEGFDAVQELFEEVLLRIRKENLLHHLSNLYIMSSGFYDKVKMYQTAVVELAKAEENLIYLANDGTKGKIYSFILHNRILILTKLRQYAAARVSIEQFEDLLKADIQNRPGDIQAAAGCYLCAILLGEEDWEAFSELLNLLEQIVMRPDQRFLMNYFRGTLYFHNNNREEAEKSLLLALEYMKKNGAGSEWAGKIYAMLAALAEQEKRYKRAAEFYRNAYEILLD